MRIDFRALLHGHLVISTTHATAHATTTNTYIISIVPILMIILILALLSAAVIKAGGWFQKHDSN